MVVVLNGLSAIGAAQGDFLIFINNNTLICFKLRFSPQNKKTLDNPQKRIANMQKITEFDYLYKTHKILDHITMIHNSAAHFKLIVTFLSLCTSSFFSSWMQI